jgi:hypothetical membrane protein
MELSTLFAIFIGIFLVISLVGVFTTDPSTPYKQSSAYMFTSVFVAVSVFFVASFAIYDKYKNRKYFKL